MLQNIYAWICILHINCFVTPNYFPFSISTRADQINGSYTTVGLPMTTWLQRESSRNYIEKAFHWPAQRDQIFMELPSTKRHSFNPSSSVPLEVKRSAGMVDRSKLLTECLATVQGNANWLQRPHRPKHLCKLDRNLRNLLLGSKLDFWFYDALSTTLFTPAFLKPFHVAVHEKEKRKTQLLVYWFSKTIQICNKFQHNYVYRHTGLTRYVYLT